MRIQICFFILIFFALQSFEVVLSQFTCEDYAPPAEIKGKKIFSSFSGNSLAFKGINYYPRPNNGTLSQNNGIDFFTEEYRHIWERDIDEFRALRINAVRIYSVDPGENHDAFMCALKAAGVYVVIGMGAECENCAIGWQTPPTCYPSALKARGEMIIKEFARYENVLAFSAGNEVSLSTPGNSMVNAPCQKQFIRDMRKYIRNCSNNMRQIPIGLVVADADRDKKSRYYNCRSDPEDDLGNAEFVGINVYLHCDGSATSIDQLAGYRKLLSDFSSYNLSIPVLITEFGCINPSFPSMVRDGVQYPDQRNFLQVDAIFSPAYRSEFQGAFVFEYSTEQKLADRTGRWGVGYFEPKNCDDINIVCDYVRYPQFDILAAKYVAINVSSEPTVGAYHPAADPPLCPYQIYSPNEYTWPSDLVDDIECPIEVPVYCLGVPGECVTVTLPPSPTSIPPLTIAPSVVPSTGPSALPTRTDGPTLPMSVEATNITSGSVATPVPSSSISSAIAPASPMPSTPEPSKGEHTLSETPTTISTGVFMDNSFSTVPSAQPTTYYPSDYPSTSPSSFPSDVPSDYPSFTPNNEPSLSPSLSPSLAPDGIKTTVSNQPSLPPIPGADSNATEAAFGAATSTADTFVESFSICLMVVISMLICV